MLSSKDSSIGFGVQRQLPVKLPPWSCLPVLQEPGPEQRPPEHPHSPGADAPPEYSGSLPRRTRPFRVVLRVIRRDPIRVFCVMDIRPLPQHVPYQAGLNNKAVIIVVYYTWKPERAETVSGSARRDVPTRQESLLPGSEKTGGEKEKRRGTKKAGPHSGRCGPARQWGSGAQKYLA